MALGLGRGWKWSAIFSLLVPSFIDFKAFPARALFTGPSVGLSYSVVALAWHQPKPRRYFRSFPPSWDTDKWPFRLCGSNLPIAKYLSRVRLVLGWSTGVDPVKLVPGAQSTRQFRKRTVGKWESLAGQAHAHLSSHRTPLRPFVAWWFPPILYISYSTFPQHLVAWARPCESQIRKRDNQ